MMPIKCKVCGITSHMIEIPLEEHLSEFMQMECVCGATVVLVRPVPFDNDDPQLQSFGEYVEPPKADIHIIHVCQDAWGDG